LTNRGYSRDGVWVGFVSAREQHLKFGHAAIGRDRDPPTAAEALQSDSLNR
jgi:beta-lactamase class D